MSLCDEIKSRITKLTKLIFIELGHNSMPVLELITPTSKKSKVYNFLKKNGDSFHHFAYEVKEIKKKIE